MVEKQMKLSKTFLNHFILDIKQAYKNNEKAAIFSLIADLSYCQCQKVNLKRKKQKCYNNF